MFSAVVLTKVSREALFRAFDDGRLDNAERVHCHHVTLALGKRLPVGLSYGDKLDFFANAFGEVAGRVMAVRVFGLSRHDGGTPHVTLATFGDAKPKESNNIKDWLPLASPLRLTGTVELCA